MATISRLTSMYRILFCLMLVSLLHAADKTGTVEPRTPALLGIVPAPAARGVVIHQVLPDSAADRAGLKVGDIILSVNGVAMHSPQEMVGYIRGHFAGAIVSIEYERGGQKKIIQTALGERLETASLTGKPAPKIKLARYGAADTFALQPGKVYIIDFWATWCGACEPVRRTLEEFKSDGKNAGVEVIGVTTEDSATIKSFYGTKTPPYMILMDATSEVTMAFHVAGYPTIAVIDRHGKVRFAGFASGGGLEAAIELAKRLASDLQN